MHHVRFLQIRLDRAVLCYIATLWCYQILLQYSVMPQQTLTPCMLRQKNIMCLHVIIGCVGCQQRTGGKFSCIACSINVLYAVQWQVVNLFYKLKFGSVQQYTCNWQQIARTFGLIRMLWYNKIIRMLHGDSLCCMVPI